MRTVVIAKIRTFVSIFHLNDQELLQQEDWPIKSLKAGSRSKAISSLKAQRRIFEVAYNTKSLITVEKFSDGAFCFYLF